MPPQIKKVVKDIHIDNNDPDNRDKTLSIMGSDLRSTLSVAVCSGGTKEIRNGMLEAKAAYEKSRLPFNLHTAALTTESDNLAVQSNWSGPFTIWDSVGSKNELSALDLLCAIVEQLKSWISTSIFAATNACDELAKSKTTPQRCSFLVFWNSVTIKSWEKLDLFL